MRFSFFVAALFFSLSTWATVTLTSVSGASNWDDAGSKVYNVRGGYMINGDCVENGLPCNSCGGTYEPCNQNQVYPSLPLVLSFTTTLTDTAGRVVLIKKVGQSTYSQHLGTVTISGSTFSINDTWANWAGTYYGTDSALTTDINATAEIGLSKANSTTEIDDNEKVTVRLVLSYVNVSDATYAEHTVCQSDTCSIAQNGKAGICYFELFPGDDKVYVDNLHAPCTLTASSDAGIDFKNIIFFYQNRANYSSDANTANAITNTSPSLTLSINKSNSDFVTDDKLTGLTNGDTYCFRVGNEDVTGNIFSLSPNTVVSCVTPADVEALLDGKKCFVATAAYGSPLHPYVEIFRKFRSEFLLKSEVGKFLVRKYYLNSPHMANVIEQKPWLKQLTQIGLWPLLLFAQMTLQWGLAAALIITFVSLLMLTMLYSKTKKTVRVRWQAHISRSHNSGSRQT